MDNTQDARECIFRIIVVGDACTGKSSLLQQYAENTFSERTIATTGIDFRSKKLYIDKTIVNLQLWDTAGQERFRTITTAYYRSADAVILVYDISDMASFFNINYWVNAIRDFAPVGTNIILVCNKCDLEDEYRVVMVEDGRKLAEELDIMFVEASAKTGENVKEVFMKITKELLIRYPDPEDAKKKLKLSKQSVRHGCMNSMKCTQN